MKDKKLVRYKNRDYFVCRFISNNKSKLFVIDADDSCHLDFNKNWYLKGSYVACTLQNKGKINTYYLHDLVLNNNNGDFTVNHVSQNPMDNRKINLKQGPRIRTSTKRKITFPDGCDVKAENVPTGIWFDSIRQRFVIELTTLNGCQILEKLTGSKELSIKAKLQQAKQRLLQIKRENTNNLKSGNGLETYSAKNIKLKKEFNDILTLSGYRCANTNKTTILDKNDIEPVIKDLKNHEKEFVVQNKIVRRRPVSKLPYNCGVVIEDLPKYCYYRQASDTRGDYFTVQKHPGLPKDKQSINTSSSAHILTKDKFNELLEIIKKLNKKVKK